MLTNYKKNNNLGLTPTPTFKSRRKWVSGFTIIEILIACSIITVSMFALMQTAQKGLTLSYQALKKSQVNLLLEEGAEAVKSIRDNNWATIDGLSLDTPYYLFFNTTTKSWILDDTSTTSLSGHIPTYPIDGVFIRTVNISSVGRDVDDDILVSGGTIDIRTKLVTISVSWPIPGSTSSKSLSFYISDIFN
ncbi:MAG: hypothetical protein UR85_C0009G0014 [Candidatus Nomurabacteria bacterium GW2011_GWF2_35_66]|uniref:Uncharacterized protein n=1 Tax=Candidatus Nomurabacteria bacterium GW2011_GWE1_35_16 TaxID=1618761 RepID=A0A0G0B9K1_9BACT|nr:MAG: hypothetical protein UR55_C0014G0014 [Candidatus Nomurabacteria bacterium GW2011_GWF1_34_20]KKP62103.1 MAG: hypothetical protein UR57_C0013G0028 [Candidatus Nomurabacteria bacterium GW2011_GWE2_34_25]KKP66069.1 MAG: hypothetical protein UR64_C0013G0028 [Candidatus Nomurabacteria bacterium GW2011_GWE1_35_16]KKP83025.1 MAG: hypothetical protein UR85_C0009G0014 [Candidatus Nomurabacteria bacterium GW2011_GWF2_35_66]HAE36978.1 hypothetical protein [Candidatus Nomurabacteria bacterium]